VALDVILIHNLLSLVVKMSQILYFFKQYPDLKALAKKFMRRFSERELAIRQFVIVKNKLMSVCNASVLLLTMNFFMNIVKVVCGSTATLTKKKKMINNRTDA